jgi:hypothetical protein
LIIYVLFVCHKRNRWIIHKKDGDVTNKIFLINWLVQMTQKNDFIRAAFEEAPKEEFHSYQGFPSMKRKKGHIIYLNVGHV